MGKSHITLKSVQDANRSISVDVRFVESSGTVLFDVYNQHGIDCLNISIEQARELGAMLRDVNNEAARYERERKAKVQGNLTHVSLNGVTYLINPDVLSNFDTDLTNATELFRVADVVLENGKVKKSRY